MKEITALVGHLEGAACVGRGECFTPIVSCFAILRRAFCRKMNGCLYPQTAGFSAAYPFRELESMVFRTMGAIVPLVLRGRSWHSVANLAKTL
jgi:hypothetical protein